MTTIPKADLHHLSTSILVLFLKISINIDLHQSSLLYIEIYINYASDGIPDAHVSARFSSKQQY